VLHAPPISFFSCVCVYIYIHHSLGEVLLLQAEQKYHSIIHRQGLCSAVVTYQRVMSTFFADVNYISNPGLKLRNSLVFLQMVNAYGGYLMHHRDFRWLGPGGVLQCFLGISSEVILFKDNKIFLQLHNNDFLRSRSLNPTIT
jgi:hypothetical protein